MASQSAKHLLNTMRMRVCKYERNQGAATCPFVSELVCRASAAHPRSKVIGRHGCTLPGRVAGWGPCLSPRARAPSTLTGFSSCCLESRNLALPGSIDESSNRRRRRGNGRGRGRGSVVAVVVAVEVAVTVVVVVVAAVVVDNSFRSSSSSSSSSSRRSRSRSSSSSRSSSTHADIHRYTAHTHTPSTYPRTPVDLCTPVMGFIHSVLCVDSI